MEKVKNKTKPFKYKTATAIGLFILLFGGMLTLATFYDLKVDQILADLQFGQYLTTNIFGRTFEIIGSWPVYIALSVAFAILFANTIRSQNKALKIAGSIAANVATVIASYVLVSDTIGYINQHFEVESFTETIFAKIVFVFVGIAIGELIILPFTKMSDETLKSLLKLAFIILFAAALSNLVVNIIKNVMNRPRFRTMMFLGDAGFIRFQPWYVAHDKWNISAELLSIGVKNDAYRSFPSGHTCAAAMSYCILALPHLFNKFNTKKNITMLYGISILITGLVAVSRMVCGAHFFSDVLVGGTITYLCVMLGIRIFIKKDYKRI